MGSANAEAEPEVRTLLRKATREDVRRPQTGESVSGKNDMVVNLLREYKGRIAEYDRKRENLANQEKLLARYEQTGDTQEAMKTRNRIQLLQEQIARDEAYLEAREKTMQNVADVTRARLENERQQTALEQELDERQADALAARRESQQESAVQSAIRQQDTAALEQRAESHEYGAVLTSYYMSGFETSGMDVEQYDRAVRAAYEQGADGWKFRRTDAQRGIADEVLQAAYNEGREKGADNGTAGTQNSGKRDAGVDTSQPSGSVGKGAGTAAEGSAGGFGIQERLGIENRLQNAGAERVSSKADGIANGTEAKTFRRVPDAMVQEYGALRQAKQIITDAGADDVRFVSGSLKVKTATGREISAQGVAQDGTVWISLSAKEGVLKTAEHEAMHVRLESETGLRERLISALGLSAEERDRLALRYCEAYEGCYTGEDLDAYLDEIVCDAYAGINRAGLGADKLQNAVRAEADRAASQSTKKPAQTRGPPETYSIDAAYAEKLKEWAGDGMPSDASFTLGTTGDVLQGLGAIESDIYMDGGKIRTILAEHPEMTLREIERIPEILDDPVMILKSRNVGRGNQQNSRLVIFGSLKAQNGKPVLSVLDLRPNESGFVLTDMQKVTSAYTKDSNPMQYVQNSEVLFADKKRTSPLLRSLGFHMPSELQRSGSIGSISYKGRSVNLRGEKFSDVVKLDDSGKTTAKFSPETQDANAEEETAEAKVYSYDKLPGKARQYVDAAVNGAVRQAANAMSIPGGAKRSVLKPAMQEMMREFLKTGTIAQETIDRSFEDAYKAGVEEDREFYDANKFVLDKMRTTGVKVPQEVRADIADFTQFRKRAMGRLLLNNEGLPVDTLYGELHEQAPGLFPEAIVNPSDQLQRMFEVADRIRVSKQTLDEAHRGDGGDFKRWAKNDFEAALEDMKASLRTAQAWAAARERVEVTREAPKTQAEVQELYKRQKEAKRVYERAQRKNLLTDADERILDRLLRGELAPEDIRDNPNAKSILNMYEAKADYAVLTAQIARWRSGVKEGYRAEVRPLLENTEQAKDKTGIAPGARYMRETMERNIEDVFPAADAAKINAAIFTPVHEQQAKSTKYKNEVRDRVRQLDLSRKIEKGNTVSEAHAVQLYGEATDNIRQLANKPMDAKRDGKTLAEWEAVVRELWESSPNLDRAKIENAVSEFRKIYDELFEKMNDVRVRNGYAPIDYRKGYFPHFQPGQTDGVLAVMGKALGIKADVTALPTSINGLTHTFKPGITWFGNAQERLCFNTAYDAVEGFDKYIEGAADIIYQTDNIQRLRAFTQELRYRTTDEGVRERVDAIRADENLSEQDKELRIKDLYENAKFELSGLAVELDEYTNLLVNKKSRLDRGVESVMGRGVYNVMNWLESRAAANMVAMNPGSWITNFIPLTQAWGYVPTTDMVRAMGQTIAAMKNDDGFWERSAFLTNRRGSDPLVRSWQDSLSAKLSSPMEWIDTFTADTIVRARYEQNIRRGMLEEDAMREADRFAANIMADRSKGATPTFFQSKNPAIKLFTQFQLEVNNQFSNIFKDLPREMRNRGLRALAVGLFKMFFGAWIYNEIYEKIVGRRAALDPIDMTNDLVGDATGYKLNNIFDAATGAEDSVIRKDKPAGLGNTVANFLTSTAEELPAIGGVLGGGRVPFSSALPDVGQIWKIANNKELDAGTRGAKLWEEVRDPLLYLGLPFGGGQVRKVAQGIMAVAQGGKFYRNNKGELQMQYPVFTDEGVMTGLRTAQATIFGRNSTKEARDWVENDFSKLSTKETNAYLAMSAAEVKQREAWQLIQAMKNVDVPEGTSEKDAKLAALNASDASDEAKALYYYNVLASTKEQATIGQMLSENADMGDYLAFRQAQTGVDGWQDTDGKTVSGSKKSELYDLLDSYDFTPEQKDAIAAGNNYKLTGFEPWTEKGKALAEAVRYGKTFTRVLSDLRREGYTNGEISEAITALFRQEYIESDETERERLRRYLANAYERVGKSRKEALQKIDAWVQ